MTEDDVLFGFRLRLFTLAEEIGTSEQACRAMGVHHSTYYRWKRRSSAGASRRCGSASAAGRGCPTRSARTSSSGSSPSPSATRASARGGSPPSCAREKWGGIRISEHGVWRVLRRYGLNTRSKRLALIARHADPYERSRPSPPPERHIDASEPGEKVQMDCFYRRPAVRHQGDRLAIHRDRRRLRLHLGRAAHLRAQPAARAHRRARPPGRRRARGGRLEAQARSPPTTARSSARSELRRRRRGPRRQPAPDQGRAPELKRLRRARPADDPRGVLAPGLRPLAGAEDHRASARPRRIPALLQLRPRPHRAPDQGQSAGGDRLRCPQDGTEMNRRYISGLGPRRLGALGLRLQSWRYGHGG